MSIEVGAKPQEKVSRVTNSDVPIDLGARGVGLVHVNEVSNGYVKDIHDALGMGDEVAVKVISVNDDGKIGLSVRKTQEQPAESGEEDYPKKYQQKDPHDNWDRLAQKKSFSRSQSSARKEDFDSLMSSFSKDNDDRLSSLKRSTEGKRGGRGGRRS